MLNLVPGHFSLSMEVGPRLGNAIAPFIGYNKVARETGFKFVPQNSPMVQFDTTPAQSQTRLLTGQ